MPTAPSTVTRDEAVRRLTGAKEGFRESYTYPPDAFDMGIELLEEGAAFTVRRAGNDLLDEIVIEFAPKAPGAMQLPLANNIEPA